MTENINQRVCPVELAGALDTTIRRWLQNPGRILAPYIKPGMNVLDIGCGPGFFTIEMAYLAGSAGQVVAADLQQEMLEKVKAKIAGTPLNDRITLHLCQQDHIGLEDKFDFILAFYMVHEVPEQTAFLREVKSLLKPGGKLLIIEPGFHVTSRAFATMKEILARIGFRLIRQRSSIINREVLLTLP